ncbi:TetR/AcrR family transcriptional regulator [Mycolicibacterium arenosum]|uniref:TetR/AcrR family transcriptional regulator n=1 Tax=Mycolicibacterium arenosum TaxID=2952157 RepID=A0ABT1M8I7_9MYCO|nr:TetR/AcrR family transcriptional regulator [Mycolicibacterium sp. CAU 1645]MCP9275483.1 TetR/AcrR family transcriptional regulator [Mycolicibacterium sp. CAU 1645]
MLLEAATQMFSREGIATTTNRIAERAGLSIGTLYQYFPDKNALLRAVAERHVADTSRRLNAEFHRLRIATPPFDETIRALLQVIVDDHRAHPRLHAVMHRLLPSTSRDLAVLRDLEEHVVEEVAFHLKRCDRGGDDVELTAQTVVAAVDAHVHRVMTERGFSVTQLTELVTALAPPR